MADECRVVIRYPAIGEDDDESSLEAIVRRHHGELAEATMLSMPGQRTVYFRDRSSARMFVDELTASGRWRAHIST